ncbi:hypothetical protein SKAU_G00429070 [Synaphobranchus kaupii]|uniref:Uncharacterized protein n=1 Tax=Synaphobranchus kaupii TaxID=118154 RepID=A0A9Q1E4H7_SYNKA|nr:hypothetical protein SKAU_G00429070 [Synaphobranchus kaupii]
MQVTGLDKLPRQPSKEATGSVGSHSSSEPEAQGSLVFLGPAVWRAERVHREMICDQVGTQVHRYLQLSAGHVSALPLSDGRCPGDALPRPGVAQERPDTDATAVPPSFIQCG